jgi:hypothetical protein
MGSWVRAPAESPIRKSKTVKVLKSLGLSAFFIFGKIPQYSLKTVDAKISEDMKKVETKTPALLSG